jgi:glycosyltransferase involved in cell wall biosynthesis
MKIGLIVDNEYNNDPRISNEAKALQKAGFEVHVLCLNFGYYQTHEVVGGINVTRVRINKHVKNILFGIVNSFPIYHYFWKTQIVKFIKQEKLDVIHVSDLYMSRSGYLAKKQTKVKLVLDLKENYPAAVINYEWTKHWLKKIVSQPQKWKRLEKEYLGYADYIVTMCDVLKERLLERYNFLKTKRIFVYMNVPDTDFLLSQKITGKRINKGNSFIVVYFGGIAIRRGIVTAIEAVNKLRKGGEDVTLLLIGPIDTPEKKLFNNYFLDDNYREGVIHIPWIELSDLPDYLSQADVGISPIVKCEQHDTTIANKMFQYSLFGKPIIVSNCVPQERIVEQDKSGLVHQSENADDLAEKILFLKRNPEIAKKMGEHGQNAVLNKYNLNVASGELTDLYLQIKSEL